MNLGAYTTGGRRTTERVLQDKKGYDQDKRGQKADESTGM